eukprot:368963-Amphidinium_carterae.1
MKRRRINGSGITSCLLVCKREISTAAGTRQCVFASVSVPVCSQGGPPRATAEAMQARFNRNGFPTVIFGSPMPLLSCYAPCDFGLGLRTCHIQHPAAEEDGPLIPCQSQGPSGFKYTQSCLIGSAQPLRETMASTAL